MPAPAASTLKEALFGTLSAGIFDFAMFNFHVPTLLPLFVWAVFCAQMLTDKTKTTTLTARAIRFIGFSFYISVVLKITADFRSLLYLSE
jgi:hypothetical protein